jgi:hypothetical protein
VAFFRFLRDCAKDPRFNPDNLMHEINLVTDLSWDDRLAYRFLIIPLTKKRLLEREQQFAWIYRHDFPDWGRGRDDSMITVSGNRLSPNDIEEAALASGAVREALAIGVPDERLGQAVMLIAVAKGDNAEQRLRAYFAAELPAYMQPREIVWRDALPTGATGKVDRAALVKEFA